MRIKILTTFNGMVNGESLHFTEGEVRSIPDAWALQFIRAHYAARLDVPAVKIVSKPAQSKGKKPVK